MVDPNEEESLESFACRSILWFRSFSAALFNSAAGYYQNGVYGLPININSVTAGVTMIEYSLVFFKNTNPYTINYHTNIRYNILYDGVPYLAVGVAPYDGSSFYVASRFIDSVGGYCYYYTCTSLSGGSGGVPDALGGGSVNQAGLLDWVGQLPIANIFSANVKAFIAPFVDRFITPLQFDVTPLNRMRDYTYFTGVVISTLDPLVNMAMLAILFSLVVGIAFMALFLSVWNTFKRLMW
jgi:hypothetical protein